MQGLDCTDIKALLSPIIDDELDADRRHEVERHLAGCAACRALLNEAEGVNELIAIDARARIDAAMLPDGFETRILQQTVYADAAHSRRRGLVVWTGWVAAAASLGLAAYLWMDEPPVEEPRQVAMTDPDPGVRADSIASPVIRTIAYTTGADLSSQTFDDPQPAEVFRMRPSLSLPARVAYSPIAASVRAVPDSAPKDDDALAAEDRREAQAAEERDVPAIDRPRVAQISREDADTLYSASLLLEMFTEVSLETFAEIEEIRQIVEVDNLIPRLNAARDRMGARERPAVFAAESIFVRLAQGPLDRRDIELMRDTVAQLGLAAQLEGMSDYWQGQPSM